MNRRWVLRGTLIFLLLLLPAAWIASCWWHAGLGYMAPTYLWDLMAYDGGLRLTTISNPKSAGQTQWDAWCRPIPPDSDLALFPLKDWTWHFLGFAYDGPDNAPTPYDRCHKYVVPFWFPTVLVAGLLVYTQRRRRAVRADRAFPVEGGRE